MLLSIEQALDLYTDKLNTNEEIDLNYFKGQLSGADYTELLELIPFVKMAKSTKATSDFDKLFEKIDSTNVEFAKELLPNVAAFRAGKGSSDKKAMNTLDEIFEEEFSDRPKQ